MNSMHGGLIISRSSALPLPSDSPVCRGESRRTPAVPGSGGGSGQSVINTRFRWLKRQYRYVWCMLMSSLRITAGEALSAPMPFSLLLCATVRAASDVIAMQIGAG